MHFSQKCKTKGEKYTAGDLKSEDYLNKLVHPDEGFRVLKKSKRLATLF